MAASAENAASESRADHAPYIAAVCSDLERRDVRVVDTMVWTSRDGRRQAVLLLNPDDGAFPVEAVGQVRAQWNEEDGWSILAGEEPSGGGVYKGLGVVPDPEDVATWAVVAVTHPELTPSREDHPFRDYSVVDASFEAQLATYAPLS